MERSEGRRPTLEDVARRTSVSRALVSIVMRGVPGASAETRQRVMAAAAEIGYRPDARARLLASGQSRLLGVVFGMSGRFHMELLDGLYVAAEKLDYQVILSGLTPSRDEARAAETLLDFRCEAVILLALERAGAAARRAAAGRRGRLEGRGGRRRRRAHLGRRGHAARGRAPGRSRPPPDPARRRGSGTGVHRAPPRLPGGHAQSGPEGGGAGGPRRGQPGERLRRRPRAPRRDCAAHGGHRLQRRRRGRFGRGVRRRAAWPCRSRCRWWAGTTARWPGCLT